MQPKKKRLEVTVLSWDYTKERMSPGDWHYDDKASEKKRHYLALADHKCPWVNKQHACGVCVVGVEIHLGDNGRGVCLINHPGYTKSGTDHERNVMMELLPVIFTNGETFILGGGGVTLIHFKRIKSECFIDTAMKLYAGLFEMFSLGNLEEAIGPQVFRKTYFWSIDLQGWIAFEDRLARTHGFKPFGHSRSTGNSKDISLYTTLGRD